LTFAKNIGIFKSTRNERLERFVRRQDAAINFYPDDIVEDSVWAVLLLCRGDDEDVDDAYSIEVLVIRWLLLLEVSNDALD
jgi:hypothetical protein